MTRKEGLVAAAAKFGVGLPQCSRCWFLPLRDSRAAPLRDAGVRLAGIAEAGDDFVWASSGWNHTMVGSIAGEGLVQTANTRHELPPGTLALVPAGVPKRITTRRGPWRTLVITFEDDERWQHLHEREVHRPMGHWLHRALAPVQGMLAEHPQGYSAAHPSNQGDDTGEIIDVSLLEEDDETQTRLGSLYQDAFSLHARILERQLKGMFTDGEAAQSTGPEAGLANLWRRVSERPSDAWDTESLASAVGVSRTTLYRMTKRQYGEAPARLVERIRMEVVCRLLSESDLSLEMIADEVGYSSAFSLSSAFKRAVGERPSAFRRRARAAKLA